MSDASRDSIRQHWDALADQYDAAKARNAAYFSMLQSAIADAVPAEARQRVLDVGCGTGSILASLAPQQGVGVDLSQPMIEQAAARHRHRIELSFHVRDAVSIDGLGPFSAVVSADLLEHVPDWQNVVRAMAGACAPGGVIAIATPSPTWALPLWVLEHLRLKMPEGPHRFVPARHIAAELTDCGCTVESITTHGLLPTRVLGFGPMISRRATGLPLLRRLGVIQCIVGRR